MNEADTRAELIDPQLKAAGWVTGGDVLVQREYNINAGEIKAGGIRAGQLKADYVLSYKNRKLAIVEAKSDEKDVGEGVAQAKFYAQKLDIRFTYAANGKEIYKIDMQGDEGLGNKFPTPEELWKETFSESNDLQSQIKEAATCEQIIAIAASNGYEISYKELRTWSKELMAPYFPWAEKGNEWRRDFFS